MEAGEGSAKEERKAKMWTQRGHRIVANNMSLWSLLGPGSLCSGIAHDDDLNFQTERGQRTVAANMSFWNANSDTGVSLGQTQGRARPSTRVDSPLCSSRLVRRTVGQ